jgi:hypothetical protein
MILDDDAKLDPVSEHERLACLECLAEEHKLVCYSSVEAMEAILEQGLDQLEAAGHGRFLRRVVLIARDRRAVAAVARRMGPGMEFIAWPSPLAWKKLYEQIEALRARARKCNPDFMPRHVVQHIGGV